jgi:uncharacterized protein (TIGR03083 family)
VTGPDPTLISVVDVASISRLERPETTNLAAAEVARMAEALRALDANDWSRATACEGWDVRAMAGHVLGMTETFTGLGTMARMMWAASRSAGDGPLVDALTALQVRATAGLTTAELVERLEVSGPVAARWRHRRRLMRRIPMKQELDDGTTETWRLGYLVDIILTRDTWMHRSDLAEAVGTPMNLTAEHDGRLIADVVAEWARRHGRPFTLHLTGPSGGMYRQGTGGDELALDAVTFCRILSGRSSGHGLLTQAVPF